MLDEKRALQKCANISGCPHNFKAKLPLSPAVPAASAARLPLRFCATAPASPLPAPTPIIFAKPSRRSPPRRPAAVRRLGGLDILVNNAGVGWFGSVESEPHDEWRRVIDTNLTGVFNCCHAAIPHLRRQGAGYIVNISSLAGKNVVPGGAGYCASKAGLNAFSEVLLQEVRQDNIRVSYVCPGSVNTEFMGHADAANDWKLRPEDVAQVVIDLVSTDRRSLPSLVELRPAKPPKK
jgi:hypothetical protein